MLSWLRAQIYDTLISSIEDDFLKPQRKTLLSQTSGKVLEVGSGTGATIGLYPTNNNITDLIYVEPDHYMRAKLVSKLQEYKNDPNNKELVTPTIISASLPSLPYPDNTFDYVVSMLVLCSVPTLKTSIAELHRILKPGGKLLFIEHVQAKEGSFQYKMQSWFWWPWFLFFDGCDVKRKTRQIIEEVFGGGNVKGKEFDFGCREHWLACSWSCGEAVKT